jgi:hypothetical protein
MNIFNWLYKRIFSKCYIHKCDIEVWDYGRSYDEENLVECPECYPELFKDYISDLGRFDLRGAFHEQSPEHK